MQRINNVIDFYDYKLLSADAVNQRFKLGDRLSVSNEFFQVVKLISDRKTNALKNYLLKKL